MKLCPAPLFCLIALLGFPLAGLSAGIPTGQPTGALLPGNYFGHVGAASRMIPIGTTNRIAMNVSTNGSILMFVNGMVAGVGTNSASGRVSVSFGDFGYFNGHVRHARGKIVGRIVLREGDKVKARRCVLERPDPAHGVVIVISRPAPASSSPEESPDEAVVESAERLQQ